MAVGKEFSQSDARYRRPWDFPDCPDCDGHVFVEMAKSNLFEFVCFRCEVNFDV